MQKGKDKAEDDRKHYVQPHGHRVYATACQYGVYAVCMYHDPGHHLLVGDRKDILAVVKVTKNHYPSAYGILYTVIKASVFIDDISRLEDFKCTGRIIDIFAVMFPTGEGFRLFRISQERQPQGETWNNTFRCRISRTKGADGAPHCISLQVDYRKPFRIEPRGQKRIFVLIHLKGLTIGILRQYQGQCEVLAGIEDLYHTGVILRRIPEIHIHSDRGRREGLKGSYQIDNIRPPAAISCHDNHIITALRHWTSVSNLRIKIGQLKVAVAFQWGK